MGEIINGLRRHNLTTEAKSKISRHDEHGASVIAAAFCVTHNYGLTVDTSIDNLSANLSLC